MAKMKTHRGTAKRVRRTASSKLKRNQAFTSHLTGKKSSKRVRKSRQGKLVKGDQRRNR